MGHEKFSDQQKNKEEYFQAMEELADRWVVAGMGSEVPFTCNGSWWIYVYNFGTGEHGYYNIEDDIVTLDNPVRL